MAEEEAVDQGTVAPAESAPVEQPVEQPQVEQPAAEPTEDVAQENMIPHSRFNEVLERAKAAEERATLLEQQSYQQPQYDPRLYAPQQPQVPQYMDPETGEIDPVAYQNAIVQQARADAQAAAQQTIDADRAWQKAQTAYPDLVGQDRELVESYMLAQYTKTGGKTQLSPTQAAEALSKRFSQAETKGAQAQVVQETIRDAAALTPASPTVDESGISDAKAEEEFQSRVNSRDKNIRQKALLELISRRGADETHS